jgi:hypothetical protein
MIIYKDRTNKNNSIYECDRCKIKLERQKEEVYTIFVKKTEDKNPKKEWDLCERCYKSLCRGIKKGKL